MVTLFKNVYEREGNWYKGNLHLHSTRSDGGKTIAELADLYKNIEYDFIAVTDHYKDMGSSAISRDDILILNGVEIKHQDTVIRDSCGTEAKIAPHTIVLGESVATSLQGVDLGPKFDLQSYRMLIRKFQQDNALIIACHPNYSSDCVDRIFAEDCYDVIEIYNHVCMDLNWSGYALDYWDHLLRRGRRIWGAAVDDAHIRLPEEGQPECNPYYGGGWITVKATQLSLECIIDSIKRGSFYSSQGPEIKDVQVESGHLIIHSSPIKYARCLTEGRRFKWAAAEEGKLIEEVRFDLAEISDQAANYFRIELKDKAGKTAWTNPFFRGA